MSEPIISFYIDAEESGNKFFISLASVASSAMVVSMKNVSVL